MEKNFSHPKYTLEVVHYSDDPFHIVEHAALISGSSSDCSLKEVGNKTIARYPTLDEALIALTLFADETLIVAYSSQAIDNVFTIGNDNV